MVFSLYITGTYTVLFFDGLVKALNPKSIKVMRPDLKKRVSGICVHVAYGVLSTAFFGYILLYNLAVLYLLLVCTVEI